MGLTVIGRASDPPTVLILAPEGDVHARAVAWELRRIGANGVILDSADYPTRWRLSQETRETRGTAFRFVDERSDSAFGAGIVGAWWRRPGDHDIPGDMTDERYRSFARGEARAALEGWAYSMGSRMINPLEKELAARRKPLQLAVAERLGLPVPRTLISNDPRAVLDFVSDGARYIYKILGSAPWTFIETRVLGPQELSRLDLLRTGPAIFQELVEGGPDIRVTIVDDDVFAAEVQVEHPEAWLDWRLDVAVDVRPHALPETVATDLRVLMRALGLRYGAIDLRRDREGRYRFFEVNPGGQYLFAEIHGQAAISASLARALVRGPPAARS